MSIRTIVKNTPLRVLPLSAMILLGILLFLQTACTKKKINDVEINDVAINDVAINDAANSVEQLPVTSHVEIDNIPLAIPSVNMRKGKNINSNPHRFSVNNYPEIPENEIKELCATKPFQDFLGSNTAKVFRKENSNIMAIRFPLFYNGPGQADLENIEIDYKIGHKKGTEPVFPIRPIEGTLKLKYSIQHNITRTITVEVDERTEKEWQELFERSKDDTLVFFFNVVAPSNKIIELAQKVDEKVTDKWQRIIHYSKKDKHSIQIKEYNNAKIYDESDLRKKRAPPGYIKRTAHNMKKNILITGNNMKKKGSRLLKKVSGFLKKK